MKAVNLIPGEQRSGSGPITGRSSGGALIVLALIVGLAGFAFMYGSAHRAISSQAGETTSLDAQTEAVRARAGKLTPYTSFVSMAEQRTQTVSQLVQARFDWSHALHELGRVLPTGTALSSLHGTVGSAGGTATTASTSSSAAASGSTPVSSTPPGSMPAFTLTGCAASQSEVAQMLQRLRLMDGASEVQLQSSTKSGASSAGTTGGGNCPGGDPTFSVQVTFTGLPASAPSTTPNTSSSTVASQSASSTVPISNGAPR